MENSPETPRSRFSSAKNDARAAFDSMALVLAAVCTDAATFKRRVEDAAVNARARYVAHSNPAWNDVHQAVEQDTGRAFLEAGEAELLAQKLEYERNLTHLDAWFPTRQTYWQERYAQERRDAILRVIPGGSSGAALSQTFSGLAAEFGALAEQDARSAREDPGAPEPLIVWIDDPGEGAELGEFKLGHESGELLDKFTNAGTRAGVALGAPRGTQPLKFFLQSLVRDLTENDPDKRLFRVEHAVGIQPAAILFACSTASSYCRRLAQKATEEQHGYIDSVRPETQKPIADPGDSPQLRRSTEASLTELLKQQDTALENRSDKDSHRLKAYYDLADLASCAIRDGFGSDFISDCYKVLGNAGRDLGCPIDGKAVEFWIWKLASDLRDNPHRLIREDRIGDTFGMVQCLLGASRRYYSRLVGRFGYASNDSIAGNETPLRAAARGAPGAEGVDPSMEPQKQSPAPEGSHESAQQSEESQADDQLLRRATLRSEWIAVQLSGKPLKTVFEHPEGPSENTLRRYRSGTVSTQDGSVRGQIARVFGCDVGIVPL